MSNSSLLSRLTFAIVLAAAPAACKPSPSISQTLEAGGTAAAWSMSAILDVNGMLYVDSAGSGAELQTNWFKGLELQVNGPADGPVFASALSEKRWMVLQVGDAGIAFDVLATTEGNQLCYANAVRLDGTRYETLCKDAIAATGEAERKREELTRSCERLSSKRIDGESSYYARYEKERNRQACTCLNGKTRDLEYADYTSRTVSSFETDCMSRDGTSTPTSSDLAAADSDLGRLQRICMAGISGASLSTDKLACRCGTKTLQLDEYYRRISQLEVDCD